MVGVYPIGFRIRRIGVDLTFCTDGGGLTYGHHAFGGCPCLCGGDFNSFPQVQECRLDAIIKDDQGDGDSGAVWFIWSDDDSRDLAFDARIRGGAGVFRQLHPAFHPA